MTFPFRSICLCAKADSACVDRAAHGVSPSGAEFRLTARPPRSGNALTTGSRHSVLRQQSQMQIFLVDVGKTRGAQHETSYQAVPRGRYVLGPLNPLFWRREAQKLWKGVSPCEPVGRHLDPCGPSPPPASLRADNTCLRTYTPTQANTVELSSKLRFTIWVANKRVHNPDGSVKPVVLEVLRNDL